MPSGRKPTSTKQRKAEIQLKRAIKRGDVSPEPKKPVNRRKKVQRMGGQPIGSAANATAIQSSRKLQSSFVKLSQKFLEETRNLASTVPLPRPIPLEAALFDTLAKAEDSGHDLSPTELSCPKRPKWRFDMTKDEVEKNEDGVFKKWLAQTDKLVDEWQTEHDKPVQEDTRASEETDPKISTETRFPRSTTYFERNIEVWRQLWRVTEISQIILVLLDSRCPLLHYPPSLAAYLTDRKVILVLTKVDISGPARAEAWERHLKTRYPGARVVKVESYVEKEASSDHQGRKMYEPHLPMGFRKTLVDAVREVYNELLEPPERVKTNEERLRNWKPPVKRDVDWEAVLTAGGGQVGSVVGGATVPRPKPEAESPQEEEPQFLTVGLIGQPNVGKSSLLNALFGAHKVRASKTPGKTKHFQTLFWTPDVRLVDCPGLVMPNFVPMETQVLCGILPISRVSAVPSCIHHASQYVPIEQVYNLFHPTLTAPTVEDKRTWRGEAPLSSDKKQQVIWTAMDVLTAFADMKGWVTAKAGRSDVHRAGNAILRALAEGKVHWAFFPPDSSLATLQAEIGPGNGVWIPRVIVVDEDSEGESGEDEPSDVDKDHGKTEGSEDATDTDEDEDENENVPIAAAGRFSALTMDQSGDEESD